jgi:hypothetical protein
MDDTALFRAALEGFRWEGVDQLAYKEDTTAGFKAITRQVLFANPELSCELRYFEIAPGGFSIRIQPAARPSPAAHDSMISRPLRWIAED